MLFTLQPLQTFPSQSNDKCNASPHPTDVKNSSQLRTLQKHACTHNLSKYNASTETNSKFYYSNSWYQNDRIFD